MPNLSDVIADVQAFYGIPKEQAEALVDRLTPIVVLQDIDTRFAVIRNDRSYWSSYVSHDGTVAQLSSVWIRNEAKSGVDVIVHSARVRSASAGELIRIGRMTDDPTATATASNQKGDPRNPATSVTKIRAGIPTLVFSQSNLYAEPSTHGYGWFELPAPFLIEPGNTYACQITPTTAEGIRSFWSWEERTQLVR